MNRLQESTFFFFFEISDVFYWAEDINFLFLAQS